MHTVSGIFSFKNHLSATYSKLDTCAFSLGDLVQIAATFLFGNIIHKVILSSESRGFHDGEGKR
jgi:hypothetical protein